jgi:hypothetical protein
MQVVLRAGLSPKRRSATTPTSQQGSPKGGTLDNDVEGIVLKRLAARHRPGERSRFWRKVKAPGWAPLHAQQRRPPWLPGSATTPTE